MLPMRGDQVSLNVRVWKRTPEKLILLWNKSSSQGAYEDTTISYSHIAKLNDNREKTSAVIPASAYELDTPSTDIRDLKQDKDTVICVINEEKASLDCREAYYVTVRFGTSEQSLKVLPAGVLPDFEKDASDKNSHNFAWDKTRGKWNKISGVKTDDGQFAMLVQLASCPSCGAVAGE